MPESRKSKHEEPRLYLRHIVRKIFLEDWLLKLTALVITLALWLGVTGLSTPVTRRLTVPLNLGVSSSSQIVNIPQQEVDIEISGDKRRVEQLNRSEIAVSVDLTDLEPGSRLISLAPENVSVSLPQGVRLIDVTPGRIVVELEAVQEKDLPVQAVAAGTPAQGYEIYSTTVLPPRIRVRGPASSVGPLEQLATDTIVLTNRKEDFTARQVAVVAPNPRVAVLNTVVDVVYRIGERRVERQVSVPLAGTSGRTVTVTLFGPRTLLQKLRPDAVEAELYLNDNGEEAAHVVLPQGFQESVEVRRAALGQ